MAQDNPADVLQGTLDLLILKTLALQPLHGWGIAMRIQDISKNALDVGQGSIYPALVRRQNQGFVSDYWDLTENNRRARYYQLTRLGRRQLEAETASWRRYAAAIELILGTS